MVNIRYKLEPGDFQLTVKGHTNYAKHGYDIICSAISTISTLTILGYEKLEETYPNYIKIKEIKEDLEIKEETTDTITISKDYFSKLLEDSAMLEDIINRYHD